MMQYESQLGGSMNNEKNDSKKRTNRIFEILKEWYDRDDLSCGCLFSRGGWMFIIPIVSCLLRMFVYYMVGW